MAVRGPVPSFPVLHMQRPAFLRGFKLTGKSEVRHLLRICTKVMLLITWGSVATVMHANAAQLERAGHLRLVDDLDRPQDGYCLDILGSGPYVRFDMPLTAHNCKPGLYEDEAVVLEPSGRILFPAYGVCATVAGINKRALAGAAVMPRSCGEKTPFLDADSLQRFLHRTDGRIELAGSGLCMTVGDTSDSTFEATHRWRTLFMQKCDIAPLSHSRWKFVIPDS